MKKQNDFEYNYVAPTSEERKEIESIRNSYMQREEPTDKLVYLRKLDNRVKNVPSTISLIVGVIGLLIFGLGFSMVLEWDILVWGIVVSVIGFIAIIIAYPLYLKTLEFMKNKYCDEILKLSSELLKDENN
ncbi:MAG: hypothetical protein IJW32_06030 [Clostridia bacterium]|nr:hypothetical protein [Clostridia bacterium]MBQ9792357.1 hypothetical protein [Clostridia bacterium]MBQ9793273.1 hypothetical protein [Clostridia bacterium]